MMQLVCGFFRAGVYANWRMELEPRKNGHCQDNPCAEGRRRQYLLKEQCWGGEVEGAAPR
jgi:hypothetical protein